MIIAPPPTEQYLELGETVLLTDVEIGVIVVARDRQALSKLVALAERDDLPSIAGLVASGQAFQCRNTTKAKILDIRSDAYEIRIVDGEHIGSSGWVPDWMAECLTHCR